MKIRHRVELVSLGQFQKLVRKGGASFLRNLFMPTERRYCQSQRLLHENYGARYAAKKAVLKVLGIQPAPELFRQVVIGRRASGQPYVILSKWLCRRCKLDQSANQIHVSLAHERHYAVAAAIMNSRDKGVRCKG
jgi:holo-[acyl-carrier-protein] synthase